MLLQTKSESQLNEKLIMKNQLTDLSDLDLVKYWANINLVFSNKLSTFNFVIAK